MNSIKLIGNNCKMFELTLMLILRFVLFRVSIVRDFRLDFMFHCSLYISANHNVGFAFEYCLVELLLLFLSCLSYFQSNKAESDQGGRHQDSVTLMSPEAGPIAIMRNTLLALQLLPCNASAGNIELFKS